MSVILIFAVALLGLVLAGCASSNGVSNIYLTSLSYERAHDSHVATIFNSNLTEAITTIANQSSLAVRTGYFGLCVSRAGETWFCANDPAQISLRFGQADDPLSLVPLSASFKDSVFFPGFMLASVALAVIAIVLLATFPVWQKEADDTESERDVKPFPNKLTISLALACTFMSPLFGVIGLLWQHVASVAATSTFQKVVSPNVSCEVGLAANAIGWAAVGLLIIPLMILYIMRESIKILDRLTDDD